MARQPFQRMAICQGVSMALGYLLLGGITQASGADGHRLRIVTSILPIFCFAINITGDLAEVENLLSPGVEPHDFQFTPREMRIVGAAEVLVVNGLGLESWLTKVLDTPENRKTVVIASAGLEADLLPLAGTESPTSAVSLARSSGFSRSARDSDTGIPASSWNPHFWLDPTLASRAVTNILAALQKADPTHAEAYARNAQRYLGELSALDAELLAGLAPFNNQAVITFHDAFPYFARHYGLRVVGIVEKVPDVDPSPRHVAALGALIRREPVRVVFGERQSPSRLVEMLGRDYHVAIAQLDTLETGAFTADAYTRGMRENLRTLEKALR